MASKNSRKSQSSSRSNVSSSSDFPLDRGPSLVAAEIAGDLHSDAGLLSLPLPKLHI